MEIPEKRGVHAVGRNEERNRSPKKRDCTRASRMVPHRIILAGPNPAKFIAVRTECRAIDLDGCSLQVGSFTSHLPFQEAEDSCWPVVPFQRQRLGVHREHAVQVAENHVRQKTVSYEAQLV